MFLPAKTKAVLSAGLVAAICQLSPAFADTLSAQFDYRIVEMNDDGEEVLVERKSVRPGETIHYLITHSNGSEEDISGLIVSGPIPTGVTFDMESQSSSIPAVFEIQAEMDPKTPGLEWSSLPAFRTIIEEDGTERVEPVPAEAVEAVRWSLEAALPSGKSTVNSYRVVVN